MRASVNGRYVNGLVHAAGQALVDALQLLQLRLGHELAVLPLVVHHLLDRRDLVTAAYVVAHRVVAAQVFVLHLLQPLLQAVQPEVFLLQLGVLADGAGLALESRAGYVGQRVELLGDLRDPLDLVSSPHRSIIN
jgi:hypothetical protein